MSLKSCSLRHMLRIAASAVSLAALSGCDDDELIIPTPPPPLPTPPVITATDVSISPIGVFETGIFDDGAAEIVSFDAETARLFIVNAADTTVDVLDLSDPTNPMLIDQIDATALGDGANSVAVSGDIVAVAIEAASTQDPGLIAFYEKTDLSLLGTVQVGALPDMVTFTPDGNFVLVANEGEPDDDYVVDPEGSVSVIDISGGIDMASVETADFTAFNSMADDLRAAGIRIFGPGASPAQDLEPEFITVSEDSTTAYVVCQENNAIAVVDIASATVTGLFSLGTKDHSQAENAFDASDRDGMINIVPHPTQGFYLPDSIASYSVEGIPYLVTANEGDTRDYDGFSEEERVDDLVLDPTAFPDAATLQMDEELGRLDTTTANGDTDGDGDVDVIFSIGARSFSIFDTTGQLVFDSGSDFETITADLLPMDFNADNDENDSFDSRSDAKGPEPEGVALGRVLDQTFAFVGLERVGGIMIYDITDPTAPVFQNYVNNRDFTVDAENPDGTTNSAVGDLGPEGLVFVSSDDSPTGAPLLIVGNEVSGTTRIYEVTFTETES